MKYPILIILALSHYCCLSADNKIASDTRAIHNVIRVVTDSVFGGHPISFYLKHKKIPQICKDLYTGARGPSDQPNTLALLDSVFTTNAETAPFYFLTITRTMKKADGAFAEPLGMMGRRFVETKTRKFIDYFRSEPLLTSKDFEEWAKIVAGEIKISSEGREKQELDKLKSKLKLNCGNCNEQQLKILNSFVEGVDKHLS